MAEVRRIPDEECDAMLRDPACPLGYRLRDGGARPALVTALLGFARRRFGELQDMQAQFEAYLSRIGGSRERPDIDVDNLTRRLARRVIGKRNPPPAETYVVPGSFLRR